MRCLNSVVLEGKVCKDLKVPMMTETEDFVCFKVCYFTRQKNKQDDFEDKSNFVNCCYWGFKGIADRIVGKWVMIEGSLKEDSWRDQQDQSRSKTSIMCNFVKVQIGQATEKQEKTVEGAYPTREDAYNSGYKTTYRGQNSGPEEFEDSDIPF